jgi:hypothetical protein
MPAISGEAEAASPQVGQIGLNVPFRSRIPTAVTGAQRNPDFDWAAFSTMFQK